jgi:hypothetical protein
MARAGKGQQGRARAAAGVQVTRGGGWKLEVVRQQLHSGGRGRCTAPAAEEVEEQSVL